MEARTQSRLKAIAGMTALFALLFQALYVVPVSERMAVGGFDPLNGVICLAQGGAADKAGSPALPGSSKAHCPFCVAAAFAAMAAVIWILAAFGFSPVRPAAPAALAFIPARPRRTQQSRAPPLPV
jgi:Protein of unknown function (DUF2946)